MPIPISYFNKRYYDLYHAHLAKRTEQEIAFLKTLGIAKNKSILDAACGYGRHALAFAKQGYSIVGVDASQEMIEIAKKIAREKSMSVKFVLNSIEQFVHAPFDISLLLFSVLGYQTKAHDMAMLRSLATLTKEGGTLILDGRNRTAVSHLDAEHKETIDFETHWLDGSEWHMIHADKYGNITEQSMLLYTPNEIQDMLREVGFEVLNVFAGFVDRPFTNTDGKFLIVAKKV